MESQQSGIEKWMTGIRSRMANDPGRQDLEDHILCNGFLFLDEYLEDILIGAKSAPIIELTKTPGRRKDTSRKDRAAATNVQLLKQLSPNKENVPIRKLASTAATKPPNPFQKALFKANRDNNLSDSEEIVEKRQPKPLSKDLSNRNRSNEDDNMVVDQQEEHAVEVMVTPPSAKPSSTTTDTRHVDSYSPTAHRATKPSSNAQLLDKPAPNESQDLSMIAETDENDISRMPSPAKQAGPVIRDKEISF
ncbi:hypothetical protein M422DRAFT_273334, partial [Sphaerobolus stellatus SS14]